MTSSEADFGIYVHWPFCKAKCPYCDFNSHVRHQPVDAMGFAQDLAQELKWFRERTPGRTVTSIFFGGGTPSLMDPAQVAAVIDAAKRLWTPADDLEIGLEANPTDAEAGRFAAFAAAGVERLSLGVQALDDAALRALGRNHGAEEARRAAALAAATFPRLSIDLIYARPDQTVEAWKAELAEAVAWGAGHISPYQLTIEAGTPFDRAVGRGTLKPPGEDLAGDLFDATQAVLEVAGFDAYEVSNHARDAASRSRHNLAYWTGVDYLGVGPGAHGRITVVTGRLATLAPARIADYLAAVEAGGPGFGAGERLTAEEVAEERLLLGLRIDAGVAFAEVAALGLTADDARVRDLVGAGLVAPDRERLRATRVGRLVLDRLTASLV